MKKGTNSLLMGMFGVAAIVAGCSSGGSSNPGSGGNNMTGSGGTQGSGSVALVPNDTGWVEGTENSLGVQGAWYAYGDGTDGTVAVGNGTCQKAMHSDGECSSITKPTPGAGSFPPSDMATSKMCTEGTVQKVIDIVGMAMKPDYSNIWGTGIGLDLAAPTGGGDKGTFDADAKGVKGISFDIDMVPMPKLRVEIATTLTKGSTAGDNYWGASGSYPASPVVAGHNEIHWAEFKGPMGAANDTAHIEALHFHVPTTTSGSAPFSYCISNLKMLMQ